MDAAMNSNRLYIRCLLNSLGKAIEKEQQDDQVEAYMYLANLYLTLARGMRAGVLHEAAIDWLRSEIYQLERDLGLQK